MTDDLDELVSLFAAKLRTDGTLIQPAAEGSRNMHAQYRGQHLTLVLPDNVLSNMLADGDKLALDLWGPGVTAKEAVARLMTVHLEESLETSTSGDIEGTWIYGSGHFVRR